MVYSVLPDSPVIHLLCFLLWKNTQIFVHWQRKLAVLLIFSQQRCTSHASSGDFPGPQDTGRWRPLLHFSCLVSVKSDGGVSKKKVVPRSSGVLTGRSLQAIWGSLGKSWAALFSRNKRFYHTEEEELKKKPAVHRGDLCRRGSMLMGTIKQTIWLICLQLKVVQNIIVHIQEEAILTYT